MNTYGVLNSDNIHFDVSHSERGAKNYATRNRYTKVSIRFNDGYTVLQVAEKVNGKWIKSN